MTRQNSSRLSNHKLAFSVALVLLPLLVASLNCTIPGIGGASLSQTQTAIVVQLQQLNATQTGAALGIQPTSAQATLQAQQATIAAQAAQNTQIASQSTQNAVATLQAVTPTEITTLAPTTAPAPSAILIKDWKMAAWRQLESGCHIPSAVCWRMLDEKFEEAYLTSKNSVHIEASWPNPYLVFWHDRKLHNDASLSIQVNGEWIKLRDYSSSSRAWIQEAIDLKPYRGKDIILQFFASVWYYNNSWLIQEVQIVPNYAPSP
jgi:hypothetical protein